MAETSYWLKSGKITLLERVFMLLFGVTTFYLLVRVLSKEHYGTWMLFVSIYAFMETARSGFFKNPLIRYYHRVSSAERGALQSTSLLLNLLFSVGIAWVLWMMAMPLSKAFEAPELAPLLLLNIPIAAAMALFGHLEYIQNARQNFLGPLIGNFLRSGLLCGFVGYFFFSEQILSLVALAFGFLAVNALAVIAMAVYARGSWQLKTRASVRWSKTLFGYGKYTLGTNLSAVFMRNIDTWMLGLYISPAAIAIYNVAIRIANLFEVPTMALAQVLFPQAVKQAEKEGSKALKTLYEKSVAVLVVMLLPLVVGVILCSDSLVALIAGPDYAEAGYILNITMLYGLIIPFNKQLGVLLDAIGKAKTNMLFVARNALINLLLNALLIPQYGIVGAAFATLSTYLVVLVINQVYLHRTFAVRLSEIFGLMRFYALEIPQAVIKKLRS